MRSLLVVYSHEVTSCSFCSWSHFLSFVVMRSCPVISNDSSQTTHLFPARLKSVCKQLLKKTFVRPSVCLFAFLSACLSMCLCLWASSEPEQRRPVRHSSGFQCLLWTKLLAPELHSWLWKHPSLKPELDWFNGTSCSFGLRPRTEEEVLVLSTLCTLVQCLSEKSSKPQLTARCRHG